MRRLEPFSACTAATPESLPGRGPWLRGPRVTALRPWRPQEAGPALCHRAAEDRRWRGGVAAGPGSCTEQPGPTEPCPAPPCAQRCPVPLARAVSTVCLSVPRAWPGRAWQGGVPVRRVTFCARPCCRPRALCVGRPGSGVVPRCWCRVCEALTKAACVPRVSIETPEVPVPSHVSGSCGMITSRSSPGARRVSRAEAGAAGVSVRGGGASWGAAARGRGRPARPAPAKNTGFPLACC